MTSTMRIHRTSLALLCLALCGTQLAIALPPKVATNWWPDPSTGLMWTGRPSRDLTWEQSRDYCASLKLGGYSDWRLPTLDEVKDISQTRDVFPGAPNTLPITRNSTLSEKIAAKNDFPPDPYDVLILRGQIVIYQGSSLWTSTLNGSQAYTVLTGEPDRGKSSFRTADMTSSWLKVAICTRTMEPALLQIAKDAQVSSPVPDLQTLKADVQIKKAMDDYHDGECEHSIIQAQAALAILPNWAPAYYVIGISYGQTGKWDLAISNLETALKIDKGYSDAKYGLKWAKQGQKAAKKGGKPKLLSPGWN